MKSQVLFGILKEEPNLKMMSVAKFCCHFMINYTLYMYLFYNANKLIMTKRNTLQLKVGFVGMV